MDPEALRKELNRLRRGRACRDSRVLDRLGPYTKSLGGITGEDGAASARVKITATIESLLRDAPRDTELTVLAALALHPETDHRFLIDRIRWLQPRLNRSERGVRRAIDDAFKFLVKRATERLDRAGDVANSAHWKVEQIHAFMNLAGPTPELTEQRTISTEVDGLTEIETRFSLARLISPSAGPHDLAYEVTYGGQIRDIQRLSDLHWRFVIELPQPLGPGRTHKYEIKFRVPSQQAMAPHYVVFPLLTIQELELVIKFDAERMPLRVWHLDGVPPRMVDSPGPDTELLRPNQHGELSLRFGGLQRGLAYGVRWELPALPDGSG